MPLAKFNPCSPCCLKCEQLAPTVCPTVFFSGAINGTYMLWPTPNNGIFPVAWEWGLSAFSGTLRMPIVPPLPSDMSILFGCYGATDTLKTTVVFSLGGEAYKFVSFNSGVWTFVSQDGLTTATIITSGGAPFSNCPNCFLPCYTANPYYLYAHLAGTGSQTLPNPRNYWSGLDGIQVQMVPHGYTGSRSWAGQFSFWTGFLRNDMYVSVDCTPDGVVVDIGFQGGPTGYQSLGNGGPTTWTCLPSFIALRQSAIPNPPGSSWRVLVTE